MSRHRARTGRPASPERADAPPLPPGYVEAARQWLGEEAPAFLAACARPPALAIRANAARGGLPALLRALGPDAAAWPRVPWWPGALLPPAAEAARLAAHPLARIGALYAQDPAALAAVALLDPRPGERVLDLCAAPGGKSTAIADRLRGQGLLVCNDVDARRARDLERTLERWGATNSAALALPPERLAALAPAFFERVLVDAPCSGEAMFARRAHAAGDWSPEHVAGCAARQRRLLHAARRMVRPGGTLVYATCTFNPRENEEVVADYLAAHPRDTLVDAAPRLPGALSGRPDLIAAGEAAPPGAELAAMARLWPHRAPGAGHSLALIHVSVDERPAEVLQGQGAMFDLASPVPDRSRRGLPSGVPAGEGSRRPDAGHNMSSETAVSPGPVCRAGADPAADVCAVVSGVAPGFVPRGRVLVRGDRAYLAPPDLPEQLAVAALAPGLRLAERRGRTWRSAHALALALQPGQAAAIALDEEAALAFLSGHAVAESGDAAGIALATWRDYPLGWARARRGSVAPLWPPTAPFTDRCSR